MSLAFIIFLAALSSSRILNQTHLNIINSFTRNCEVVKISDSSEYGIISKGKIKYGDTLMVIPPNYILTSFDSYAWSSHFRDSSPSLGLIARLLYEKHVSKDRSNRRLLIDTLPTSFSSIIDMTESERDYFFKYFGGQEHLNLIINCEEDFKVFEKIHPDIKKCHKCNQSEFIWACKVVFTRAFKLLYSHYVALTGKKEPIDMNKQGGALIFGVEFFNHCPLNKTETPTPKINALHFFSSPSHIEVKSERDAEPGSELFMSYGSKKNLELFIHHGFFIENNPDDFVKIAVPSDQDDCSNYDPFQLACFFEIQKFSLNPDILNYLFYRISGTHQSILSFNDLISRQSASSLFSISNILKVLKAYRILVQNHGVGRCQPSFRETKRQVKQSNHSRVINSINLLCLELDSIYVSHLILLDQAILRSLLLDFD